MVIFTWDIATEWHNCTSPDQFNGRNAPFPPADNFEHLIIGTQFHCEVSFFCDEHGKLRGTGPAKRKDNVCFVRARVAPWASLAAKAVCGYRRAGKLCVLGAFVSGWMWFILQIKRLFDVMHALGWNRGIDFHKLRNLRQCIIQHTSNQLQFISPITADRKTCKSTNK